MKTTITRSCAIVSTARVKQLCGLFEVSPTERTGETWEVDLPIEGLDWNVGLIVGPSGSGKSTVAQDLFGDHLVQGYDWPADKALVDGFPAGMGIKEITGLLSSVGFSSPPSWLRPFRVLSNGEQFRATIARALAEEPDLAVVDEFTSVIDRQVARIGSAAVAKAVRRRKQKFIAVTCHYDVADWLCPDWVLEMPSGTFTRRSLQRRPAIELEVRRVHSDTWKLFCAHHYLNTSLHKAATCFVAFVGGTPAAFASVLPFPHPKQPGWREHRTVCLPDYQGVGVGNALSDFVASLFKARGDYRSTTSSPAMTWHRAKSPVWEMIRKPELMWGRHEGKPAMRRTASINRLTAGFRYVGPARPDDARGFGVI